MQNKTDLARALRDSGIKRAVDHADMLHGDWHDKASTMLLLFMQQHRGDFMAEQVRTWAEAHGLPLPPDNRAWGAIFIAASKSNVIRSTGYAPQTSPGCHRSPKNVWVAA
jgi:hypothetical protein